MKLFIFAILAMIIYIAILQHYSYTSAMSICEQHHSFDVCVVALS